MSLITKSLERSCILINGILIIAVAMLFVSPAPLHAQAAGKTPAAVQVYKSQINTVNQGLNGNAAKGTAEFRIAGDELLITVNAEGLTPDMKHLIHLHGFVDGKKAACATPSADANKDGVVDVKESVAVTGPELIPLNDDPQDLEIKAASYPKATKQGTIQYSKKVSLKKLMKNMQKKYKISTLNLENMALNIHGVDKKAKLPASVQSVMKLPAYQTVPVACGEIKKAQQ
ncbi:MAG TPA: hypothetical protein PLA83_04865 [Deltaproteobacteria bacterium]|nr:hypothetical protein [Deltaproteobacteria bacterium]HQI00356.1 hypothetical protein [Deltaproteobacteria bacterium]HQJ09203.1 hypothetical protein [Deltaproteobacteria bacterium]